MLTVLVRLTVLLVSHRLIWKENVTTRSHTSCAPYLWPNSEQWPYTTGGNQFSYTYIWIITSFSRAGMIHLLVSNMELSWGVLKKMKDTIAFLQVAVLLPFSCPGRTEFSLVNLMGDRDSVQHWDSCHLLSDAEGNQEPRIYSSHLGSSVPPSAHYTKWQNE